MHFYYLWTVFVYFWFQFQELWRSVIETSQFYSFFYSGGLSLQKVGLRFAFAPKDLPMSSRANFGCLPTPLPHLCFGLSPSWSLRKQDKSSIFQVEVFVLGRVQLQQVFVEWIVPTKKWKTHAWETCQAFSPPPPSVLSKHLVVLDTLRGLSELASTNSCLHFSAATGPVPRHPKILHIARLVWEDDKSMAMPQLTSAGSNTPVLIDPSKLCKNRPKKHKPHRR